MIVIMEDASLLEPHASFSSCSRTAKDWHSDFYCCIPDSRVGKSTVLKS